MNFSVIGNREPFQLNKVVKMLEIRLDAEDMPKESSMFSLAYGERSINISASTFYSLSQNVKGSVGQLDITLALNRLNIDPNFANSFLSKSLTEVSLFKSIFLIYYWVSIAFTDPYAISIDSKVYDEFIVDYNNKLGSQPDIYFIKHGLISSSTQPYLDRLVELNLLVKLSLGNKVLGHKTSYFIPLIKPGVSREYFTNKFDIHGDKTYGLWKEILNDRDTRLRYWSKNRF